MLAEAEAKADWHWLMDYDDKFEAVTTADIKRVAPAIFHEEQSHSWTVYPSARFVT